MANSPTGHYLSQSKLQTENSAKFAVCTGVLTLDVDINLIMSKSAAVDLAKAVA